MEEREKCVVIRAEVVARGGNFAFVEENSGQLSCFSTLILSHLFFFPEAQFNALGVG